MGMCHVNMSEIFMFDLVDMIHKRSHVNLRSHSTLVSEDLLSWFLKSFTFVQPFQLFFFVNVVS